MHVEDRGLRLLLRVVGAIMTTAVFAVLLPVEWMAWCHGRMGLGEFPVSPIVDYLARSLSLLYALLGGLLVVISFDPRRYRAVLIYIAAASVVASAALWGIDLHAGMPALWTAFEGPPAMLLSALLLWCALRLPRDPDPDSAVRAPRHRSR